MLEKILDGNIQIIDSVSDWKESIKIAATKKYNNSKLHNSYDRKH